MAPAFCSWDLSPITNVRYHYGYVNPYELNGRIDQKRRTRDALVAAARALVAQGETPTVEAAAEAASISRTTAYRYFPNQHVLLVAAHPETGVRTLLPDDPPVDAASRLELVIDAFTRSLLENEAQQRTMLRLSLEADPDKRRNCHCGKAAASSGSRKHWHHSARKCPSPRSTGSPSPYEAPRGSKRWSG
jgi:hypothetical protein